MARDPLELRRLEQTPTGVLVYVPAHINSKGQPTGWSVCHVEGAIVVEGQLRHKPPPSAR